VVDLRAVCEQPQDYLAPIGPSVAGGGKIARAAAGALAGAREPGARLFGA
jgi:hypothetical protein